MQPSDIDKGDWRLQTTTHLAEDWTSPWTGIKAPKGTRITLVSIIQLTNKKLLTVPLPNATASMLNASARAYENACALRIGSEIDKTLKREISFKSEKDALDYIERMIEAIVLAFSAIEAFANESIPNDFVYARHKGSEVLPEAASKETIERHISTDEKLTLVLPKVLGCNSPKGTHCWQNYRQLKGARDRIIHMKTEDRKSSGPDVDTVWKAIVLTPAPHLSAKAVIDYFVKSMNAKPQWHERFLHAT
ncbi:MAG: hypothetical protein Q8K12_11390 [Thiobacillus sp.]|nr:hypothetical protein [Thiobacillus sp.]